MGHYAWWLISDNHVVILTLSQVTVRQLVWTVVKLQVQAHVGTLILDLNTLCITFALTSNLSKLVEQDLNFKYGFFQVLYSGKLTVTVCMQKIYDWHKALRKATLEAMEALWASDKKYFDPEDCKAYVEYALGPRLPFLYGKIDHYENDIVLMSKAFLTPLILQMFAAHLSLLALIEGNSELYTVFTNDNPHSTLVLTVKHTLHMYHTGKKDVAMKKSELSFSETHWGTKILYYIESIKGSRRGNMWKSLQRPSSPMVCTIAPLEAEQGQPPQMQDTKMTTCRLWCHLTSSSWRMKSNYHAEVDYLCSLINLWTGLVMYHFVMPVLPDLGGIVEKGTFSMIALILPVVIVNPVEKPVEGIHQLVRKWFLAYIYSAKERLWSGLVFLEACDVSFASLGDGQSVILFETSHCSCGFLEALSCEVPHVDEFEGFYLLDGILYWLHWALMACSEVRSPPAIMRLTTPWKAGSMKSGQNCCCGWGASMFVVQNGEI
ncbi:hypothetical protein F5J12DRAFT_784220 [Pisolithus orientalis]|uniref:uncharacterized protein n=1 Tax=Pisolithus orientalis TaxID=936130 RepID=UPI002224CE2B|nr:uncharacterized protein F5J12DRAFT_784220 [Pisolithus orientalis]KAI6000971.1 hypothetical protein F5J12DRAFT_784220 [Pisolithus orientalis]